MGFFLTKPGPLYIIRVLQPRERQKMAIKINDIPPEGLRLELSDRLEQLGEGAGPASIDADITITPSVGGAFRITGSLRAETTLECNRCLKRFPFGISEKALEIELQPGASRPERAEHELDRAELDVEFYAGDEIDPLEIMKEQLLLALPMVPVHSEGCRGLCPVCGTDRNERECGCTRGEGPTVGGPFSGLKDILKKKE